MDNHYAILMSTIIRDSGLVNSKRVNDNVRVIERALKELEEREVIYRFDKEERRGERNKLKDILYTLYPTLEFISEMKKANKRSRQNAAGQGRHAGPDQQYALPPSRG